METFESIRTDNRLLYQYIRGSHAHGISTPSSDIDRGGIFIAKHKDLIDLGFGYQSQIADEKNDEVWYELKKYMALLIKSNPTVLESLFVDDKFVEYEHPLITELKKNREMFLTKRCFPAFFSYAKSQIEKAKGLNKMINWDKEKIQRKGILDFTYTFYNQGSTKIENWLEYRSLKQEYCGLVNIPNMRDIYGVYYDWGNFFLNENISFEDLIQSYEDKTEYDIPNIVKHIKNGKNNLEDTLHKAQLKNMVNFIIDFYNLSYDCIPFILKEWYETQKPIGYRGMVNEAHTSHELRLSSVSKAEKPICYVSYNKDGFIKHCKDYKNYKDWEMNRNPIRYESNLKKSYDAKNMCECFRLMTCGIEIANGNGYIVDRSGIDADFLLDVKNHKFEYEELMEKLELLNKRMDDAMSQSKLKDDIDQDAVNMFYLDMLEQFFQKKC